MVKEVEVEDSKAVDHEEEVRVYENDIQIFIIHMYYSILACKRKRRDDFPEQVGALLTELNSHTMTLLDEHHRKVMILEAELEEKRRRQEQEHEERMMGMMMTFIKQVAAPTPPPFVPQTPYGQTPYTFPPHQFPSPSPSYSHPGHSSSPHPSQCNLFDLSNNIIT